MVLMTARMRVCYSWLQRHANKDKRYFKSKIEALHNVAGMVTPTWWPLPLEMVVRRPSDEDVATMGHGGHHLREICLDHANNTCVGTAVKYHEAYASAYLGFCCSFYLCSAVITHSSSLHQPQTDLLLLLLRPPALVAHETYTTLLCINPATMPPPGR